MLATESRTLDEAVGRVETDIEALENELDDMDPSTDQHQAVQSRIDRLRYYANGLQWQRDEAGWGGDAVVEMGSLTAGEKAMMHREAPDSAERHEMVMWYVAASTAEAPYADDDLSDTFAALADCHPGFVEWAEATTNALGVPGAEGNGSAPSSTARKTSETPREEPDSPTSSPSASHTD